MAEQQHYEFAAVDAKDIVAQHQRGWEGFTQFLTYGIAVVVILLLALLLFVA
ncbi:aa3-type cytochrome c oxidase subunit IV [Paracraurococcus lichenis]|uniref:Aa3-type cytochrome c oxidase subunit IV n=1 Tax=Paracraurococcus lichenis TaxID=3064888 RepID=A0ABT9E2Z8_9PROT|nr:aa3-type cytochrome c oxidase subunit IV [Paracraurococcus sp. LOR1-02]MDO9710472.1 aa3-type cytochrome c oxidase subunit IV [Paracraurococcus sp. LOR1-02]